MLNVRSAGEGDIPSVLRISAAAEAEPSVTDDDDDSLSIAEIDGVAVGALIAT